MVGSTEFRIFLVNFHGDFLLIINFPTFLTFFLLNYSLHLHMLQLTSTSINVCTLYA
jgi:hypothetical protein